MSSISNKDVNIKPFWCCVLIIVIMILISIIFRVSKIGELTGDDIVETPSVTQGLDNSSNVTESVLTPTLIPTVTQKIGVGDLEIENISITPRPTKKPSSGTVGGVEIGYDRYGDIIYKADIDLSSGYLSQAQYESLADVAAQLYCDSLSNTGEYSVSWSSLTSQELKDNYITTYYNMSGGLLYLNLHIEITDSQNQIIEHGVKTLILRYELNELKLVK